MLNRYAESMDDLSQLLEYDQNNMPAKKELEILKKLQNESCVGEVYVFGICYFRFIFATV